MSTSAGESFSSPMEARLPQMGSTPGGGVADGPGTAAAWMTPAAPRRSSVAAAASHRSACTKRTGQSGHAAGTGARGEREEGVGRSAKGPGWKSEARDGRGGQRQRTDGVCGEDVIPAPRQQSQQQAAVAAGGAGEDDARAPLKRHSHKGSSRTQGTTRSLTWQ